MLLQEIQMNKLWVDDFRNPPQAAAGYDIARTYDDAIDKLNKRMYDEVFLDHDLGDFKHGKERSGYDVLMYIVQMKMDGKHVPSKYTLLTDNPVGRQRMQGVIDRYLSG